MFLMKSKIPRSTDMVCRTDWHNKNHLPKSGSSYRTPLKIHLCHSTVWTGGKLYHVRFSHAFNQQVVIGLHTEAGTVLVIHPKEHEKYYSKCQHYLHDSLKYFKYIYPGPKYTFSSQRLYYSMATPLQQVIFSLLQFAWPQRESWEESICRMLWVNQIKRVWQLDGGFAIFWLVYSWWGWPTDLCGATMSCLFYFPSSQTCARKLNVLDRLWNYVVPTKPGVWQWLADNGHL